MVYNGGDFHKSHVDVGKKDIAPITVLPFALHRFDTKTKDDLVESAHLLFIEPRWVEALGEPLPYVREFFGVKLVRKDLPDIGFLLWIKVENFQVHKKMPLPWGLAVAPGTPF